MNPAGPDNENTHPNKQLLRKLSFLLVQEGGWILLDTLNRFYFVWRII